MEWNWEASGTIDHVVRLQTAAQQHAGCVTALFVINEHGGSSSAGEFLDDGCMNSQLRSLLNGPTRC